MLFTSPSGLDGVPYPAGLKEGTGLSCTPLRGGHCGVCSERMLQMGRPWVNLLGGDADTCSQIVVTNAEAFWLSGQKKGAWLFAKWIDSGDTLSCKNC